jgi:hypothetical protein
MVIQHREAINCIALSLMHKSLRYVRETVAECIAVSILNSWRQKLEAADEHNFEHTVISQ